MTNVKIYVGIWAILVVATLTEVFMRMLPLSTTASVTLILLIALGKAIIIALYFQRLRYETGTLSILPIAGIVGIAFLAITAFLSDGM